MTVYRVSRSQWGEWRWWNGGHRIPDTDTLIRFATYEETEMMHQIERTLVPPRKLIARLSAMIERNAGRVM